MLKFALRRIALSIVTLLILVFAVFLMTYLRSGDTARQLAGPFAPEERVAELTERLGLDEPGYVQFGSLLKSVATFDFGESFTSPGVPVSELVSNALWNSAKLVLLALALTLPLSIAGGILAARKKDTLIDRSIVTVGLASASIPDFVSGVILQFIVGAKLGWLPTIATIPDGAGFFTQIEYLLLPALAVVAVYFGYIARVSRAGTIMALEADYTRTAYMKGLRSRKVITGHVMRNSLQPTVAVTGTQIGYLFGGLVGLERVFNYPGLGRLIFRSATQFDFPVLQASVITVAIIFMVCTLAADLLIAWMNPRARQNLSD